MTRMLFENAAILDVERGRLRTGSVLVDGERIVEVANGPIDAGGATRIDVRGRTLMPGLIDAHVHVCSTSMNFAAQRAKPASLQALESGRIIEGMLRRGFTTVRDVGGADHGFALATERGVIRGPRIFYCGMALSQTGGHGDGRSIAEDGPVDASLIHREFFGYIADGVDAVRRAAREQLRKGAHHVKIMASGGVASPSDPIWVVQYTLEEMRAAVEEAAAWRTYVVAHAYTAEAIRRCVEAGVRTVEHCNLIDEPTAKLMAERGVYMVPTLITYKVIKELGAKFSMAEHALQKVNDVLAAGLRSIEIARGAGVKLGWGTDLLGETHPYESEEFLIRGQVEPAADVIRSATLINAEILQRPGELGVIAPGAYADLLVVNGNPLDDLSVLTEQGKHLDLIVKGGQVMFGEAA